MATANQLDDNATVSSEAVELLGCFADELGEVVLKVAADFARRRGVSAPNATLEIESEDVKSASGYVLSLLREQIAKGIIPADLKEALDGAEECFRTKCRET